MKDESPNNAFVSGFPFQLYGVGSQLAVGNDLEVDGLRLFGIGIERFPIQESMGLIRLKGGSDGYSGIIIGTPTTQRTDQSWPVLIEFNLEPVANRPSGVGRILINPVLAVGSKVEARFRTSGILINMVANLFDGPCDQFIAVFVLNVVIENVVVQRGDVARWTILGASLTRLAMEATQKFGRTVIPDSQAMPVFIHQRGPVLRGLKPRPGKLPRLFIFDGDFRQLISGKRFRTLVGD